MLTLRMASLSRKIRDSAYLSKSCMSSYFLSVSGTTSYLVLWSPQSHDEDDATRSQVPARLEVMRVPSNLASTVKQHLPPKRMSIYILLYVTVRTATEVFNGPTTMNRELNTPQIGYLLVIIVFYQCRTSFCGAVERAKSKEQRAMAKHGTTSTYAQRTIAIAA